MNAKNKEGSHKNIWYGIGRQRIEIPKTVLKQKVQTNTLLNQLYVCSLGYYPNARGHYTYRKKGLPENFLFYCVDGAGWYQIGDKKQEVGPNQFFILPQNVEHAYGSDDDNPWSIYWIHFGGESLPQMNSLIAVQKHFKPFYIKSSGEIITMFSRMYKALELGYSTDNLIFANLSLPHFLSLFIYNSKHTTVSPNDKLDVVDSAILYMQEHINENISLQDLSSHYNYSASRFSSLFKQKTGYAPIDYFIQMKMQKASQQLDFSSSSVKDIALSMGFDDPYYFSKRFRKIIGLSPKQYRSQKKD
ncbi:AraC family transcriptional regulator [Niastella yeongjuensis]|uniref:AraC family transcriptional regulator n=1 Tax=Niastella yeongjuensis TaxID=354355 RepID=A0A1V9DYG5_9BACT|nr:AraC family transcriptional regulator [Niastella yeongjuensis]OQP38804.1 AraC family transcriptional regulator [Niastella yeongjuensis]SEO31945.1 AraC-like ligand binding domain-containing protein [Niastella yeongjuensis]